MAFFWGEWGWSCDGFSESGWGVLDGGTGFFGWWWWFDKGWFIQFFGMMVFRYTEDGAVLWMEGRGKLCG